MTESNLGDASDQNPFAAPTAAYDDELKNLSHTERTRREHLQHESNIKSIGSTYLLIGGLLLIVAAVLLVEGRGPVTWQNIRNPGFILVASVSFGLLTVSVGMNYLRPWARTPAMVLSVILIAAFPVGTLLGPYFIYLLRNTKTEVVLSGDYRDIIRQTRHVKMKTPLIAWIVLVGFLTIIATGIVFSGFE